MTGTINFANPNYHESQPFPIEQPLAETVATNPAASGVALPLLLSYMSQRQGAQADYQNTINQQHQMATGALAENQNNNARERLIDILKLTNPGALGAATTNAYTAPLLAGTDIGSLQGMSDFNNRVGASKVMESVGKGVQGAAMGGMQPNLGQVSSLTGLQMSPYTPPVAQAASINAGGRITAAGISANGGGGGSVTMPLGPPGPNQPTVHLKGSAAQDVIRNSGGIPGSKTNLPPAPSSTQQQSGGHITAQTLQAARVANPQAYNDIMNAAKATGGQVAVGKSGGLVGASGTEY